MATKRTHWRRTPAEKALTAACLVALVLGLTLEITTSRTAGTSLLALGVIGNTGLTFRLIGRADREESAQHARERAERKRDATEPLKPA